MARKLSQSIRLILMLLLLAAPAAAIAEDGPAILKNRCAGCHAIDGPIPATLSALTGRKGPELYYAGVKYKTDWLASWLVSPVRIRPAGMYYGNHVRDENGKDVIDEGSLPKHMALPPAEADAVAKALGGLKAKGDLVRAGEYKEGSISLSMGEMFFDKFRGCMACHEIEPGYGGLSGPEVYTAAQRLNPDYLISFMRDPQAWVPGTFMPNKHLSDKDLQKFVHYLRALAKEDFE